MNTKTNEDKQDERTAVEAKCCANAGTYACTCNTFKQPPEVEHVAFLESQAEEQAALRKENQELKDKLDKLRNSIKDLINVFNQ